jgi:hypothetical protein
MLESRKPVSHTHVLVRPPPMAKLPIRRKQGLKDADKMQHVSDMLAKR